MSFTFISRSGSETASGTIVLWYGTKAAIPAGWAYYSAAAGMLVMGATSANTTPAGDSSHKHGYSANTGDAGSHSHTFSTGIGSPSGTWYTAPASSVTDKFWASNSHTNHSVTVTGNAADPDHHHALLETGGASNLPPSFGLYYIRKV